MERALSISLVSDALGNHPTLTQHSTNPYARMQWFDPASAPVWPETAEGWTSALPTAEELQALIAQTEVNLFLNNGQFPEELLRSAWYLHGVASSNPAAAPYTVERRRNAFALSAHIFDLATTSERDLTSDRLRMAFAAQVGYHRGDREPNAIAVERRMRAASTESQLAALDQIDMETLALEAGVAFLGLDTAWTRQRLRFWRQELDDLNNSLSVPQITATIFGPTFCVVEATHHLLQYLTLGATDDLDAALTFLRTALTAPEGVGDHDARWVASHLRFLADEMGAGSVWNLLPPDIPPSAKQAFTLTSPAVLALWQPQRALLRAPEDSAQTNADQPNTQQLDALNDNVRRIVLSVPTSAGKTLISQLLTVSYLSRSEKSVCFIVPQRSLGREIRRDMRSRLLLLGKNLARDLPDFGSGADQFLRDIFGDSEILHLPNIATTGDVSIITPEGLDQAIRQDPEDVLDRYGMFVFDEVHLLKEKSRGFKLESVLSYLHLKTRATDHKIILLSAALGNAAHLASWVSLDEPATLLKSDWRGPRRLHAVYNSSIDWNSYTVEEVRGARGAKSHLTKLIKYPTYGRVRLRPAQGQSMPVETTEPIGVTAFRATESLQWDGSRDGAKSTASYVMLAEIVRHVAQAGPVLIFRSSRKGAVQMAKAIGDGLDPDPRCADLAQIAIEKLSDQHPLPRLLAKGVAFHHAGLPIDIQEAIEDGIRGGALTFVSATTVLAEGVNLPVRTVVLAVDSYPGQAPEAQLTGSRLVNAVGRAGRATKESEGWVIVSPNAAPSSSDFDMFEPADEDLEISSVLGESSALEALAVFEDAYREGEDALMSAANELADFVKFVWFVLASAEEATQSSTSPAPFEAFANTLAFSQLSIESRTRYENVISAVEARYASTDPSARLRWSRTGAQLSTARKMDELAREAAVAWPSSGLTPASSPEAVLDFLGEIGSLAAMLELAECPRGKLRFKSKQSKNAEEFEVAPEELLKEWVSGASLLGVSDRLFSRIESADTRLEAAVDSVTDYCEHYFAWMLSAFASLVNEQIDDADEQGFPTELPAFVRYGVRSSYAVEILTAGVHSRDLANAIAVAIEYDSVDPAGVVAWLSAHTIDSWRRRFAATNLGVRELLEYCRNRDDSVLQKLLTEGSASISLNQSASQLSSVPLRITSDGDRSPSHLVVHGGSEQESIPLGVIPIGHHVEVEILLSSGLDYGLSLESGLLTIELAAVR